MKKIPLTQGKYALVDDEDYDRLMEVKWTLSKCRDLLYAKRYDNNKYISMHRVILGLNDPSIHVDHINGNGLDNQRKNLRICTRAQNMRNRKRNKDSASKYKGAYFDPKIKSWRAQIVVGGQTLYLGRFKNDLDAAYAYNVAAKKYHGEFAKLNELPPGNYTAVPDKLRSNNTTGYTGTTFHKGQQKYAAQIVVNRKRIHLGTFDTAEEAARAYNAAALKYHGPKARLNEL